MEFAAVIIVAAAVFGLCFLVDKGFTKLFRSQAQHKSGLSVRLSKRYGSFGILLTVFGIAGVFMGLNNRDGLLIPVAGGVLIITGICLVVYYMTFGVFYDATGFVLTTFGRGSVAYTYRDIRSQQLYNNQGHLLIELHLRDGRALQLQGSMEGVYPFLDYAFERWCAQMGRRREDCPFYDPQNSCWFPLVEEK